MKVWTVIGGWDYEGCSADSLRLFDCKSAALEYEEELKEYTYDYVIVRTLDVCMESAIKA